MNRLLIVGGPSIDTLHLKDRLVTSAGGAGMYTAMAAWRCGARVAMFSYRLHPCPSLLRPVEARLEDCFGPPIDADQTLRFEISYRQGKTEYLDMFLGAQTKLLPRMLPDDLSHYDLIHVIPLARESTLMQIAFVEACRERGAHRVSAGTFPLLAEEHPQALRDLIEVSDYFFMNDREAAAVFGSIDAAKTGPGKVLYVTRGEEGATVIQGEWKTEVSAVSARELDPTGAGDTFCGATLAFLLQNEHPVLAARHAAALAAEMIEQVGPMALLLDEAPPPAPVDVRAQVNEDQVGKVAAKIAAFPDVSPFPFTGPVYPAAGQAKTLDYFFASTLQQFSFWSTRDGRYHQPMIATIGGEKLKGSDYLWAAYTRRLESDPEFCSPERQAALTLEEMLELYRADDGSDPMPDVELHLQQARSYGRDMLALNLTPQIILDKALASPEPLHTFLELVGQVGGYKEDPLVKKSNLLALILQDRPEKFLPLHEDEEIPPIIDYHLMRSALRVGLVDVCDQDLQGKLQNRQLLTRDEEWAVRYHAYRATEQVTKRSGRSSADVDWFFFNARNRCPEMSDPQCSACPIDDVCAHRKELFQPVLRTSFY